MGVSGSLAVLPFYFVPKFEDVWAAFSIPEIGIPCLFDPVIRPGLVVVLVAGVSG